MRPITLSICNRSYVHPLTLQRSGRSEYDAEIATDVLERGRFLVDIPGRDLGGTYRIFHRKDAIVGLFDRLTDEAQVGRTLPE